MNITHSGNYNTFRGFEVMDYGFLGISEQWESDRPAVLSFMLANENEKDACDLDIFAWLEFMSYLEEESLGVLSLGGADPFDNLRLATDIVLLTSGTRPDLTIRVHTKHKFEDLIRDPKAVNLLMFCDYLDDGRVIDVQESLRRNCTVNTVFESNNEYYLGNEE